MKKIFSFFILSLFFISCSSDDNFVEEIDRGFIEVEFENKTLSFGEKSYTGWLLHENNKQDTIARIYTTRIDLEGVNFYEIEMYAYFDQNQQVEKIEMKFLAPYEDRKGSVYQHTVEDNPMIYSNITFDGLWLKGEFEGYLYYNPYEREDHVHLTKGKFHFPVKGLDIDWSQW